MKKRILVKRIVFIRHAKVNMDSSKAIYAKALKQWEESYNNAPIHQDIKPDESLVVIVHSASYVLSSTLRRSLDSLSMLSVVPDEANPLFNEAAIPKLKGSVIKLKPVHWLLLFRILSLLGIGRWARTLKATKSDAHKAAERLIEISKEHQEIVLMGHGVMNWLIRKELSKQGWRSKGKERHSNWGSTILICDIK